VHFEEDKDVLNQDLDSLDKWYPWREWVDSKGSAIFRTHGAFDWFLRKHKEELINEGVFIVRVGQAGSLIHEDVGKAIIRILKRTTNSYAEDALVSDGEDY
jgi:hypothetical protein